VEGDTPAFLGLIPNGLNVPDRPDFGGWGGRYELGIPPFESIGEGGSVVVREPVTRPIWTNASDSYTPYLPSDQKRAVKKHERTFTGNQVTLWRWRDDFQNDFAARVDWTIKPFAEANHPPVPVLEHPERLTVKSGQRIDLAAQPSYDPDGDSLSFYWFHYPEAGSWPDLVPISQPQNTFDAWTMAPEVDKPETLHFILRVRDKGTPPLTRYKRVIVTVEP
jgi:hypothetical protein